MKLFWSILALLVLAAGGFLILGAPDNAPASPRSTQPATDQPPLPPISTTSPDPLPPHTIPLVPSPNEAPKYPDPDSIADALISGEWGKISTPTTTPSPSSTTPTPPPVAPGEDGVKANPPPYTIVASTIVKRDDGSILIDDRFTIRGDGTPDKPYEITWDLLTSAEHTFDPRTAMKKIPQGVAMLDGKHVRIKGFVAFPLYVEQPRELLAMLNQWDGCCIGVPPTPYDAIEVRLAKEIRGDDRFASSGVLQGVLSVSPYITGNWLVGLYILDRATLKPEAFGGANAGSHGQ